MFDKIITELADSKTQLVAVSKTRSTTQILAIYQKGHKVFGENKAQELKEKYAQLPKDIDWHFIGHLQTNKVKLIVPFVHLIHTIDSLKLLQVVNKEAIKADRVVDCLLQFHIAEETSKFGLNLTGAKALLNGPDFQTLKNTRIVGVMGMGTFTNNPEQTKREFQELKSIFDTLKRDFFPTQTFFKELSMGMSGDYQIAIETGSTMVRIGSLIFS